MELVEITIIRNGRLNYIYMATIESTKIPEKYYAIILDRKDFKVLFHSGLYEYEYREPFRNYRLKK